MGNIETHYQECQDNLDAADDVDCICSRLHEEGRQDAEEMKFSLLWEERDSS